MSTIKIKEWAKSLSGGLSTIVLFAAALLASPELLALFPATWVAVLTVIAAGGTIFGITGLVPNRLNAKQIINAPATELAKATGNIAGTVAVTTANTVSNAINAYILQESRNLPEPAREAVEQIADSATAVGLGVTQNVVDSVLDRFNKVVR